MADPAAILRSVFGFASFRPGKAEIVAAVQDGRDVLAIMPTGGGKSLCFQLPALCREGGDSGNFTSDCADARSGARPARSRC